MQSYHKSSWNPDYLPLSVLCILAKPLGYTTVCSSIDCRQAERLEAVCSLIKYRTARSEYSSIILANQNVSLIDPCQLLSIIWQNRPRRFHKMPYFLLLDINQRRMFLIVLSLYAFEYLALGSVDDNIPESIWWAHFQRTDLVLPRIFTNWSHFRMFCPCRNKDKHTNKFNIYCTSSNSFMHSVPKEESINVSVKLNKNSFIEMAYFVFHHYKPQNTQI